MTDFNKLAAFELGQASHETAEIGLCAMEAVAWLEGLPHSDRPECTDETIAAYVRWLNDELDHISRQKLVPYLPRLVGTVTNDQDVIKARKDYLLKRVVNVILPDHWTHSLFNQAFMAKWISIFSTLDATNKDTLKAIMPSFEQVKSIHEMSALATISVLFHHKDGINIFPTGINALMSGIYPMLIEEGDPSLFFETLDGLLAIGPQSTGFSKDTDARVKDYEALFAS